MDTSDCGGSCDWRSLPVVNTRTPLPVVGQGDEERDERDGEYAQHESAPCRTTHSFQSFLQAARTSRTEPAPQRNGGTSSLSHQVSLTLSLSTLLRAFVDRACRRSSACVLSDKTRGGARKGVGARSVAETRELAAVRQKSTDLSVRPPHRETEGQVSIRPWPEPINEYRALLN